MRCQLMDLARCALGLPPAERLERRLRAIGRAVVARASLVGDWAKAAPGRPRAAENLPPTAQPRTRPDTEPSSEQPKARRTRRFRRLRLQPGERVRVRSHDAILGTLDHRRRCAGLPYMAEVMQDFCGQEFVVRRRVERFFDEGRWRMLRLQDVVLLEGVYCEPRADLPVDWAGCGRSCLLFWSEAWLERVTGATPARDR